MCQDSIADFSSRGSRGAVGRQGVRWRTTNCRACKESEGWPPRPARPRGLGILERRNEYLPATRATGTSPEPLDDGWLPRPGGVDRSSGGYGRQTSDLKGTGTLPGPVPGSKHVEALFRSIQERVRKKRARQIPRLRFPRRDRSKPPLVAPQKILPGEVASRVCSRRGQPRSSTRYICFVWRMRRTSKRSRSPWQRVSRTVSCHAPRTERLDTSPMEFSFTSCRFADCGKHNEKV